MDNSNTLVVNNKLQAKIKEKILETMGDFIDDVAVESIINEVYQEELEKVRENVKQNIAKVFAESLSAVVDEQWKQSQNFKDLGYSFRTEIKAVLKEIGFDSIGMMLHQSSVNTINGFISEVENAIRNSEFGNNFSIQISKIY